jgi:hypothetical protein
VFQPYLPRSPKVLSAEIYLLGRVAKYLADNGHPQSCLSLSTWPISNQRAEGISNCDGETRCEVEQLAGY